MKGFIGEWKDNQKRKDFLEWWLDKLPAICSQLEVDYKKARISDITAIAMREYTDSLIKENQPLGHPDCKFTLMGFTEEEK